MPAKPKAIPPESLRKLAAVLPVETRAMFGGIGIYSEGLFFALVGNGSLYFKVDDSNRGAFEKAGAGPFRPFGPEGGSMSYYLVPDRVLAKPATLKRWAEKALDVAREARAKRKPNRPPGPSTPFDRLRAESTGTGVKRTGSTPRAGR
jgi:DNA transformation protein